MLFSLLKAKYSRFAPASFFVAGFLFDVFTAGRIDESGALWRQVLFLLVLVSISSVDLLERHHCLTIAPRWSKLWSHQTSVLHFLLGGLLSTYTIFYFKSSSDLFSVIFVFFLAALLVANELPQFRAVGARIRISLISLCLLSWMIYVIPILVGEVGPWVFLLSLGCSTALLFAWGFLVSRQLGQKLAIQRIGTPSLLMTLILGFFYFTGVLPPVPLSIQYFGVYHDLEKKAGQYFLHYDRHSWKFWQNGAQSFDFEPGDRVVLFARIFSPTHFEDQIFVQWQHHDGRSWKTWDTIPFQVVGGRAEGFRGFVYKKNIAAGEWRAMIQTADRREIGRMTFEVHLVEKRSHQRKTDIF